MTKQEWIEVLNATSERDWTDWLIIIASIVSPIIVLMSTVFAAMSAKSARKAADLSLKMYEEQKEDQEKAFFPLFETTGYLDSVSNSITFRLHNRNNNPITIKDITNVGSNQKVLWSKPGEGKYRVSLNGDSKTLKSTSFEVIYNALNHQKYSTEVFISITTNGVLVTDQRHRKIL